jgi:hypothetical protein
MGFNYNGKVPFYETPYINRSVWANVHLGSNETKNVDSDLEHDLGLDISSLRVELIISEDGTDATAKVIDNSSLAGAYYGFQRTVIDNNTLRIQTGSGGLVYLNDSGADIGITTQDWYYKIVVYKTK